MSGGTQHRQPCNLVVVRKAYVVGLEGETLMLSAAVRCFTRRFPPPGQTPQSRQRDVNFLNVKDHLEIIVHYQNVVVSPLTTALRMRPMGWEE